MPVVYKTNAYAMPIVIVCATPICFVTNDEGLVAWYYKPFSGPVLPPPATFMEQPADGETLSCAIAWNVKADAELLAALQIPEETAKRIGDSTALFVRLDDGDGYIRIRLGTLHVTPGEIRDIIRQILLQQ
jgi:hypothetical protein